MSEMVFVGGSLDGQTKDIHDDYQHLDVSVADQANNYVDMWENTGRCVSLESVVENEQYCRKHMRFPGYTFQLFVLNGIDEVQIMGRLLNWYALKKDAYDALDYDDCDARNKLFDLKEKEGRK